MNRISLAEARRAIGRLAILEGVSERQVRREINTAIDEGMSSTDPKVRAQWDQILRAVDRDKPTPEEFIAWAANRIRQEKNDCSRVDEISGDP